jgi:murein DD-endopeptidase MepM/ murein hydrolase activator NlpD
VTCKFGSKDPAHNDKKHPVGHGGIDLAGSAGTSVLAARDGTVLYAGAARGYGHWVVLKHSDGQLSIYGHLGAMTLVRVGQNVQAGDIIGTIGTTGEGGHSSGPHLHFQINKANTGVHSTGAIDPTTVLPPAPTN